MEENDIKEVSSQGDQPSPQVIDVFEPKLTLSSKRMQSRKLGVNFYRLRVGFIDLAGDKSPELEGITVAASGGLLLSGDGLPEGIEIDKLEDGFRVSGRVTDDSTSVVFDFFPDGKSQAGAVTIGKDGVENIVREYEFTPASLHWMFDVAESLVWAFFIAMIIRLVLFQTFFIPSGSMEPTLFEGDRIVANKLIYRLRTPHRGEVIIFKVYAYLTQEDLESHTQKELLRMGRPSFKKNPPLDERFMLRDYIKRVAALPGDEIEIRDRQLFVNGGPVDEPWVTDPKYDFNYSYGPKIVPEGHIFVIGDNHRNSQDSHKLGFLPISSVVGKAMFVFYPPSHITLIE
jgi:signal peptidase I